ncbi:MAG TPA: hypothetical protein VE843_15990, partial [Ktedonobacteraceae bacterium]|nr:hypothetical protein [Ktedonobacteraceae bacterium]
SLGQRGISAHTTSRINLAEAFVELLEYDPMFEVVSSSLSIVAFRCLPVRAHKMVVTTGNSTGAQSAFALYTKNKWTRW